MHMSEKIPEILNLIRDVIVEKKTPLGFSLKKCGEWCKESSNSTTILYSGCLYLTMGLVEKIYSTLKIVTKNPAKEGRVKLLRKFMGIGGAFVSKIPAKQFSTIPRKALEILNSLGYDVGCLNEEPYNGALLYDLGFWDELRRYGEYLRDLFNSKNTEEIILLDPHAYDVFVNFYSKEVPDFDFKIKLFIDIIYENLSKINLAWKASDGVIATYHDPCHYSKGGERQIINEPRRIIKSIKNVELREPFNNKALSICCGGPLEFVFSELSEKIAKMRYDELLATGAEYIITACPICTLNLRRVAEDKSKIIDLIDLIHMCMEGEKAEG